MTAIVCVDRNWAIGRENKLLFRIPADLRRFRALTMGYVLLMGRGTFESLPGLLPGRKHIVLSRNPEFACAGATVCNNIEAGIAKAKKLALEQSQGEVFVVGGEMIYKQLLPRCDTALVTQVDAAAPAADAFFPNLDELPEWEFIAAGEWQGKAGLRFRFCEYRRI